MIDFTGSLMFVVHHPWTIWDTWDTALETITEVDKRATKSLVSKKNDVHPTISCFCWSFYHPTMVAWCGTTIFERDSMDLIQQNQIYRLPLLTLFGNGAKGCALLWPGRMFGISAEETDLKKINQHLCWTNNLSNSSNSRKKKTRSRPKLHHDIPRIIWGKSPGTNPKSHSTSMG